MTPASQTSSAPRIFACGALLVLLTFAAYSNSFRAPLVMDDVLNIQRNSAIRQLWPLEPAQVPGLRGRPVANFTYAVNYAAGGLNVAGYHAVNLAIHVAAGLVLLGLVRRTLLLPPLRERFGERAWLIACAAAALWLLHPLQTEAVTYLSQRTESLMALCYLFTLYAFVRGVTADENKSGPWFIVAVLSCLIGIGCKEVIMTAPVMVLLYDRTFFAGSFREAWRARKKIYLALAACWVALPILMSDFQMRGLGLSHGISPWRYALLESRALLQYFRLTLCPSPLVFDYGMASADGIAQLWPYALTIGAILVGVVLALIRRPLLGFLLAWPFLLLAPSSSIIPVAQQPVAEHRMYLPLAGLAVLGAWAAFRYLRGPAPVVLGLITVGLAAGTYDRNAVYGDELRLWQDTVAKSPNNTRAHQNLANAYVQAGRLREAEESYQRALTLTPLNPDALNNLGMIFYRTGRTPQAVAQFRQAREIAPLDPESYYNLGCLLLDQKNTAEAEKEFTRAIELSPRHSAAHNNLATILVQQGKFPDAIEHYSQALQANPADAEVHANRAFAFLKVGRLGEAIRDYEQAVQLNPQLEGAKANLEKLRAAARSGR